MINWSGKSKIPHAAGIAGVPKPEEPNAEGK